MYSRPTPVAAILLAILSLPLYARDMRVDCNRGQSINDALAANSDRVVVEISGTCAEDVLIDRDHVALIGVGAASIVGAPGVPTADRKAGITIRGATNVLLSGLTVTDSDSRGIEVDGSSAVTLDGVTATGNRTGLLAYRHSAVLVRNSSFDGNTGDGIGLWDSSQLTLEGTVSCSSNTRAGILGSGASSIILSTLGANTTANGNNLGFYLQLGAQAQMSSGGPFSTSAANNAVVGVDVTSESHWSGGITIADSDYAVAVETSASFWAPSGALSLVNGYYGIFVVEGSTLSARGAVVTGFDVGLSSDASGVNLNNATLSGNSLDVELAFGSQLTAHGASAGTVWCDGTVLTRGSIGCPSALTATNRFAAKSESAVRRPQPLFEEPLTMD